MDLDENIRLIILLVFLLLIKMSFYATGCHESCTRTSHIVIVSKLGRIPSPVSPPFPSSYFMKMFLKSLFICWGGMECGAGVVVLELEWEVCKGRRVFTGTEGRTLLVDLSKAIYFILFWFHLAALFGSFINMG